jgi:predicted acetyltransferase
VLTNAYDCYSIGRQFTLMMTLASVDEKSCKEKEKIGRSIAKNFEKCADFEDVLKTWDANEFTEEERKSVVNAVNAQRTDDKGKIKGRIESIISACQKTIKANPE